MPVHLVCMIILARCQGQPQPQNLIPYLPTRYLDSTASLIQSPTLHRLASRGPFLISCHACPLVWQLVPCRNMAAPPLRKRRMH